jgi:regulatory protein
LIKFRARSEKEILDKLKQREYPSLVIAEVIAYLNKTKQLDDRLFAKLWVDSRIKRSLGIARLRHELRNKGIDKNIIEEVLSAAGQNYSEEDAIRKVIEHKLKNLTRLSADKKLSRLYGYLARRGYPKGIVVELLFEYIKPDEAQDTGS